MAAALLLLLPFPVVFALLLLIASVSVILAFLWCRFQAPASETLEWIAFYDRPKFNAGRHLSHLDFRTLLFCTGTALLCGILYILSACLKMRDFVQIFSSGFRLLLTGFIVFILSAVSSFYLCLMLTDSLSVSIVWTILLGIDYNSDYALTMSLSVLFCLFYAWMQQSPETPFFHGSPFILGAVLAACVSLYISDSAAFPILLLAALWLLILAFRFHCTHRNDRLYQLLLSLILPAICFLCFSILVHLFGSLVSGTGFDVLLTRRFWRSSISIPFKVFSHLGLQAQQMLYVNIILLFIGTAAAACSCWAMFRLGHSEGLILPIFMLSVLLMLFIRGDCAIGAAAVPAGACFTTRLIERKHPRIAIAISSGMLILTVLSDLILLI